SSVLSVSSVVQSLAVLCVLCGSEVYEAASQARGRLASMSDSISRRELLAFAAAYGAQLALPGWIKRGPLVYRLTYRVTPWRAGERPEIRRERSEGVSAFGN